MLELCIDLLTTAFPALGRQIQHTYIHDTSLAKFLLVNSRHSSLNVAAMQEALKATITG